MSGLVVRMEGLVSGVLECPWCGDEWTHVDKVRMEARGEDRPILVVEVDLETAVVTSTQTDRIAGTSRRRHSVSLSVYCETCARVGWVHFSQHKGQTRVLMEHTPARVPPLT